MRYLKNTWYVAAWSNELHAEQIMPRKLFGKDLVLFRKQRGAPAAIADYCPHRFAPLHLGRLKGDFIECGYHGLQFDGNGECVHNPHGAGQIPKNCRVASFPMVEKHGVVWIWPGDVERADPGLIPDFSYLVAPDRKTVFGMANVKANYELITDNLMDASHTQYVHQDSLGTEAFAKSTHIVKEEENCLHSNYLIPDSEIPQAYKAYFPDQGIRVDYSANFKWHPASLVRNSVSLIPPGRPPEEGVLRTGTHLMTPEDELSTHYFFSHTRNFQLDDPEVDERIRWWQRSGLMEQDGKMIEAAQRVMQTADLDALKPILFSIDTASVRVRRLLARLIDEEAEREHSTGQRRVVAVAVATAE